MSSGKGGMGRRVGEHGGGEDAEEWGSMMENEGRRKEDGERLEVRRRLWERRGGEETKGEKENKEV